MNEIEKAVLEYMQTANNARQGVADIAANVGCSVQDASCATTILELNGLIKYDVSRGFIVIEQAES